MLRVGTDCSGIEAPIQALKRLKIPFKHVFASDIDKDCIKSIKANYNPEILFGDPDGPYPDGDITKRDHSILPKIDLYVCGFPCQPFSSSGLREGLADKKKGTVFFSCMEVIKTVQPKCFILENVKGILSNNNGKTWKIIQDELAKVADRYYIDWKILNTKDFGIPQNRERVFIIGTRMHRTFVWPTPTKMGNIHDYVDWADKKSPKTIAPNIQTYLKVLPKNAVFVDIGRTKSKILHNQIPKYSHLYTGTVLAKDITWCYPLRRFANVKELLALQGFPKNFKQVVSTTQMKHQIGNSMSVNVLSVVIKNLLRH